MKLTKAKVRFILRQKRKGVTTKEISWDMKITQRKVQQVLKEHKDAGKEPVYCENLVQPRKPYNEEEALIVKEAHYIYRLGVRILEYIIRKQYSLYFTLSNSYASEGTRSGARRYK